MSTETALGKRLIFEKCAIRENDRAREIDLRFDLCLCGFLEGREAAAGDFATGAKKGKKRDFASDAKF
jgi:hypothetical protein